MSTSWGFSVSPEELAAVGDRLGRVGDDLERAGHDGEGTDAYMDDLGHEGLASVVGSFETNWSFKRHDLVGDVRSLAASAHSAADTYRETDEDLAGSLSSGRSLPSPI